MVCYDWKDKLEFRNSSEMECLKQFCLLKQIWYQLIEIKLFFLRSKVIVIDLHQKKLTQTRGAVRLNILKQRHQRTLH